MFYNTPFTVKLVWEAWEDEKVRVFEGRKKGQFFSLDFRLFTELTSTIQRFYSFGDRAKCFIYLMLAYSLASKVVL